MQKIKQTIPNLHVLRQKVHEAFKSGLPDFVARTDQRRIQVIKNQRYVVVCVLMLAMAIPALYLGYVRLETMALYWYALSLLIVCFGALVFSYELYHNLDVLAQEINLALVPMLTGCFNQMVIYTHDLVHREQTWMYLSQSKLFTSAFDRMYSDDMYSLSHPYPLSIRELRMVSSKKNIKNILKEKDLFKGVLVVVELPKKLKGETYISTEGDKEGFAHLDFWNQIVGGSSVEETLLESNQFEKDLHVATNNPTEARTILTPDFMVDLHDWWQSHRLNIRMAFIDNKFFMLLPDTDIRMDVTVTSRKTEKLEDYAISVATPIWRSLTLVEDINL